MDPQHLSHWEVSCEQDRSPLGDGFHIWYISNGGFIFISATEAEAKWLCDLLNKDNSRNNMDIEQIKREATKAGLFNMIWEKYREPGKAFCALPKDELIDKLADCCVDIQKLIKAYKDNDNNQPPT